LSYAADDRTRAGYSRLVRSPRPTVALGKEGVQADRSVTPRRRSDVLGTLPLFVSVPRRHLRRLAEVARDTRFAAGSTIVRKGERGEDFYVLVEGTASIVRGSGLPAISIGPGSYFGEMSLIDGEQRSATVVAKTDLVCLKLSQAPFSKMLRSEPEIALAMLRELAGRIRELQGRSQLAG
jgi:CRP-like cAMP-binding protein